MAKDDAFIGTCYSAEKTATQFPTGLKGFGLMEDGLKANVFFHTVLIAQPAQEPPRSKRQSTS